VEVVALIRHVLCLIAKVSDLFLEQRISIKFCVKLKRDGNNTCPLRLMAEKL